MARNYIAEARALVAQVMVDRPSLLAAVDRESFRIVIRAVAEDLETQERTEPTCPTCGSGNAIIVYKSTHGVDVCWCLDCDHHWKTPNPPR